MPVTTATWPRAPPAAPMPVIATLAVINNDPASNLKQGLEDMAQGCQKHGCLKRKAHKHTQEASVPPEPAFKTSLPDGPMICTAGGGAMPSREDQIRWGIPFCPK
eukprot:6171941-Amphidinium_carterae.1